MRYAWVLRLALLALFPAVVTASAIASDFSKPGSFAIGFQKFKIPDVTGKHTLKTYVWYPAAGPAPDPSALDLKTTPDAPPAATGPYPLVVLIPGQSMSGMAYGRWGQLLASYGFVTFAASYDPEGTSFRRLYNRVADVIRAIEYADTLTARAGKLAGLIDTSRIGVWGHSSGGTTALQAGGARIDFKALDGWCAANKAERFSGSCEFVGLEKSVADLYGAADPFAELMPSISDRRVAALVLAAPGDELQVFGKAGIAEVKVPTLIMVTSDDDVVKPEFNALWAYDGIGSPDKALAVFDKGGHMMFAGYTQFDVALSLTIAFFLHILKSDPAGKAVVLSEAVSIPGLTYRTTLR